MSKYFFTRREIADELGIDPKTFRRRLNEYKIELGKGLIPSEKVKEIKLRLKVEPQNQFSTIVKEKVKENFNKYERSFLDNQ